MNSITGRSPNVFPFRELPIEIQLYIFRFFKAAIIPNESPTTGISSLREWLEGRVKLFQLDDDENANWETALRILCLDKSSFEDFAPHFYQHTAIRFYDPITFADRFLANTTNACLYNLRYLSCILDVSTEPHVLRMVRQLGEVIKAWPELGNLTRFEFIYYFGIDSVGPPWDTPLLDAVPDTPSVWSHLDRAHGKIFSKLQRRALATAFKGFAASRSVTSAPDGLKLYLVSMGITFTNENAE
jgi:hypothetical protein